MLDVDLLGPVAVRHDGSAISLRRLERAILASLAAADGRPVSAAQLVDDLWGEHLPDHPAKALQIQVSRIRSALGAAASYLVTTTAGYAVDASCLDTDIQRLRAALVFAASTRAHDAGEAADALAAALESRGPALSDLTQLPIWHRCALGLDEERLSAVEVLASVEVEAQRHAVATARLEALLASQPLRERAWALLLRSLAGDGRQVDALRAYQRARSALAEAGVAPGPELAKLERLVLLHDASVVRAGSESGRAGLHVPQPTTRFVGRVDSLDGLLAALDRSRLVTVRGPGGVGKSRLTLEAMRHLPAGRGLVWWVDLSRVANDRDVDALVVATVGSGADPISALSSAAPAQDVTIVLDTCEHIVAAAADLIERLLRGVPGCSIVATSRHALDLSDEVIVDVPPLGRAEAEALFFDRAAGLGSPEAVAELCERLDHMPLAVELAAAVARAFTVEQILERLDDQLSLLVGPVAGTSAHTTLERAIAWSYDLLSGPARTLLGGMTCFPGGFRLEDLEAVATATGFPESVPAVVHELVSASLVQAEDLADGRRLRLLDSVAAFAARHILSGSAETAWRRAHLAWVAQVVPSLGGVMNGAHPESWTRTDRERANIVEAVRWAIDSSGAPEDVALAARIAASVDAVWLLRGRWSESQHLCAAVLAHPATSPHDRARLLTVTSQLALLTGDLAAAEAGYRDAIRLAADDATTAMGLSGLGAVLMTKGKLDDAVASLEASLDLIPTHVGTISMLGTVRRAQGDGAAFIELQRRAIAQAEEQRLPAAAAAAGTNLALALVEEGELDGADEAFGQCLALRQAMGDRVGVATVRTNLANLRLAQDRPADALTEAVAAGTAFEDIGHVQGLGFALQNGAEALLALGRPARAAAAVAAALTVRRRADVVLATPDQLVFDALVQAIDEAAGPHAVAAALLMDIPHPLDTIEA